MIGTALGRVLAVAVAALLATARLDAQNPAQPAAPAAPPAAPSAKAAAPVDLTGYWVSMITEDWRWRVVTPPKGDVLYLPVNAEGRRVAGEWDPAKDAAAGEECRGYGAGGVMRIPGRLHITWESDQVLRLDADAGTQTRRFHFGAAPAVTEPTWQGRSLATWQLHGSPRARTAGPRSGELRVVTDNLRPGYLRRNGVPYSAQTRLTEHFATLSEPGGVTYLVVTTILEDPRHLAAPYVRSYQFRRQADAAGWNPTPCSAQ